jgi:hypothetical protein
MFGMMLKYSGIDFDQTARLVEGEKERRGVPRDPFDPPIFALGFESFELEHGRSGAILGGDNARFDAAGFCERLKRAEQKHGISVSWLGLGGTEVKDLSGCVPCDAQTKQGKHFGMAHVPQMSN